MHRYIGMLNAFASVLLLMAGKDVMACYLLILCVAMMIVELGERLK